jgi:hypothetical protein
VDAIRSARDGAGAAGRGSAAGAKRASSTRRRTGSLDVRRITAKRNSTES